MAYPTVNGTILPNDILYCIFSHLSPGSNPCAKGRRRGNHTRYKDMLRASLVCSTWRKSALGFRDLWTYITIPDPPYPGLDSDEEPEWVTEWNTELLRRSEPNPLSVCIELQSTGSEFCKMMKLCMHRVMRMCIHCDNLQREHPLVQVLTRYPAGKLESLSFHCRGHRGGRHITFGLEPHELFRGSAPLLKRLTISPGIDILPSAIHQLVYHRVAYWDVDQRNGCDLHCRLSRMTSLEELEIESDADAAKLDWERRPKIRLAKLNKLIIRNDVVNFTQLLDKITVPSSCVIHIIFEEDCFSKDIATRIVHWWTGAGRGGDSANPPKLIIDETGQLYALDLRIYTSRRVVEWRFGASMADDVRRLLA
ncbi:hypothetical protein AX15_001336 [Amanita polypyramis BW_CC]|nr:hypothetical protein AX15_001336 [Amanita polypyramis BW_CC]